MSFSKEQKVAYLLSHTIGIGCIKGKRIIDNIPNIIDILTDLPSLRSKLLMFISEKDYTELCVAISTIDWDYLEALYKKKEVTLVSILEKTYPKSLLYYEDMPLLLYCKGDISLLNKDCIAVVGTRYPTKYGQRVTEDFVNYLIERFVIVSGLARGVDSISHRCALNNRGQTIAVLGCGIDKCYPSENFQLYTDIENNGLIISEYDVGVGVNAHNFPARNRIISGLSKCVLVTEAGKKSGTMITIDYAEKQGKTVCCVPGSIYNKASEGCNQSIRQCQSRFVISVNDIYDELGLGEVDLSKPSEIQLDFNESMIIEALTKNGEMHFEELVDIVDLNISQLNSLLVKMELVGLINKTKFNYWSV